MIKTDIQELESQILAAEEAISCLDKLDKVNSVLSKNKTSDSNTMRLAYIAVEDITESLGLDPIDQPNLECFNDTHTKESALEIVQESIMEKIKDGFSQVLKFIGRVLSYIGDLLLKIFIQADSEVTKKREEKVDDELSKLYVSKNKDENLSTLDLGTVSISAKSFDVITSHKQIEFVKTFTALKHMAAEIESMIESFNKANDQIDSSVFEAYNSSLGKRIGMDVKSLHSLPHEKVIISGIPCGIEVKLVPNENVENACLFGTFIKEYTRFKTDERQEVKAVERSDVPKLKDILSELSDIKSDLGGNAKALSEAGENFEEYAGEYNNILERVSNASDADKDAVEQSTREAKFAAVYLLKSAKVLSKTITTFIEIEEMYNRAIGEWIVASAKKQEKVYKERKK